jgi:hypothetical protein
VAAEEPRAAARAPDLPLSEYRSGLTPSKLFTLAALVLSEPTAVPVQFENVDVMGEPIEVGRWDSNTTVHVPRGKRQTLCNLSPA